MIRPSFSDVDAANNTRADYPPRLPWFVRTGGRLAFVCAVSAASGLAVFQLLEPAIQGTIRPVVALLASIAALSVGVMVLYANTGGDVKPSSFKERGDALALAAVPGSSLLAFTMVADLPTGLRIAIISFLAILPGYVVSNVLVKQNIGFAGRILISLGLSSVILPLPFELLMSLGVPSKPETLGPIYVVIFAVLPLLIRSTSGRW